MNFYMTTVAQIATLSLFQQDTHPSQSPFEQLFVPVSPISSWPPPSSIYCMVDSMPQHEQLALFILYLLHG